jgi:hypothetical protein
MIMRSRATVVVVDSGVRNCHSNRRFCTDRRIMAALLVAFAVAVAVVAGIEFHMLS